MAGSKIPKYHLVRIYAVAIAIYFMLILPVILVLSLKMAPALFERRGGAKAISEISTMESSQTEIKQNTEGSNTAEKIILIQETLHPAQNDSLQNTIDSTDTAFSKNGINGKTKVPVSEKKSAFERTFSLFFRMVILFTVLAGLIINAPLKRYFSYKRKHKAISIKRSNYCKKLILYTPYIYSSLLFFSFLVMHGYMIYLLASPGNFDDQISRNLFQQFFYISLVASLLLVLFVFFWQKHRVHIIYLEHLFDEEELYKRRKVFFNGKIQNRLMVSSAMTTLLPLAIVLLYLLLGITPVKELGEMTPEQAEILVGPYKSLLSGIKIDTSKDFNSMYYVNAIDNILMFTGIAMGILVALIYIVFFVRWTTASILRPVEELLQNMRLTTGFQINNYTIVRGSDEIGELGEGYNLMTRRLMNYIDTISRMNEIYLRFVPQKFLQILGKESFADFTLGDQIQKKMTILFSDIRSFTEMSETMTPKENFDFINHYLGLMEPIFARHNGFIDKFIGDSIMALFAESVDDAIDAAIEMRIELRQFNKELRALNKHEIDIGIGIHTGNLMLGIIGGKGRMDGTVISDAVNLASRLEGLTKLYGAPIILSEDALLNIHNKDKYYYRFLDEAFVKGKRKSVKVFEILNSYADEELQAKLSNMAVFQQAITVFQQNKFLEALGLFDEITASNPTDVVAGLYAKRCRQHIEERMSQNKCNIDEKQHH